jgi:hypothetical protein
LHEYRKEMDAAVSYKETKLGEMSNHLDLNIFKLSEQVSGISGRLEEAPFTDAAQFADFQGVIDDLTQQEFTKIFPTDQWRPGCCPLRKE